MYFNPHLAFPRCSVMAFTRLLADFGPVMIHLCTRLQLNDAAHFGFTVSEGILEILHRTLRLNT